MSSGAATNSVYLKASSVTAWQTASMLRMKKTVVNRHDISPEAHLYARYGNSCFRFISTCAQTCCSIYMYMYIVHVSTYMQTVTCAVRTASTCRRCTAVTVGWTVSTALLMSVTVPARRDSSSALTLGNASQHRLDAKTSLL